MDAFDWLPRLKTSQRPTITVVAIASSIYSTPDEIESEIKKRVKMPKQTGLTYQKVFSRGGNVVSKGQKNKKMMDKIKKQQGRES